MGILLCKSCCCPCRSERNSRNSVGVVTGKHLKILLLGLAGSGKTEIAHILIKKERTDYEPTNGSKYYQTNVTIANADTQSIGITEIGGSADMQRIWHHYFASTMAIIYCFDMSASYELLCRTFQLLDKVLSHAFVRGKSILLIGTKSDLVDEGLQLYDIENTFQLAAMANKYACNLRICYAETDNGAKECNKSLIEGIQWLIQSVLKSYDELSIRTKGDTNLKNWQEQTEKLIVAGKMKRWSYRRFPQRASRRRKTKMFWKYASKRYIPARVRPNTAPSLYTISRNSCDNSVAWQNSVDTITTTMTVPNHEDETSQDFELQTESKRVTHI